VASQYGNSNVTINNGNFVYGLLDPFPPNLDRGAAEFDIRHRVTVLSNWRTPVGNKPAFASRLLGGWSLNPMFIARTGQPFSVFDSAAAVLDLNTPRAVFTGPVSTTGTALVPTAAPNTFQYLTFQSSQIAHTIMTHAPGSSYPRACPAATLSALRDGGIWM